jgi:hypothetical protein
MAIKLGPNAEIDDTGMDAKTRGAFAAIAQVLEASGAASAATAQAIESIKQSVLTKESLAEFKTAILSEIKANPPKPGDKPTGDKPADDATEALLAKFAEMLKPLSDKVTAFETKEATAAKAAAAKEAVEKYVGSAYGNYVRKGRLQRELAAFAMNAEKLDDATLKREAERICDTIAQDEGRKNHAEFVGANPPKKAEGGGGGGDDEKAERKAAALEYIGSKKGLFSAPPKTPAQT